MVQGNVTAANSVDYQSGSVILGVSIAIGSMFIVYMVYKCLERDLNVCFMNYGCTCLLPSRIHPDGTEGIQGIRQPTSAEYIIALSILAHSPSGTSIKAIQSEIVKGPPVNNAYVENVVVEPEWKKKQTVIEI